MAGLAAALVATAVFALPAGAQTATGSSSVGIAETSGGDGGSTTFVGGPVAVSGSSGASSASSTATNTGDTGDATSIAISNPVSGSGISGDAGSSGATDSTPSATNSALLGTSVAASGSPAATAGNQAASAAVATESAGATVADAATAGAPALAQASALTSAATELGDPPAFEQPAAFDPVVPSGGVGETLANFSRTIVDEYSQTGATNLLVLVLGFLMAAKLARTFLRLNTYWDLRA